MKIRAGAILALVLLFVFIAALYYSSTWRTASRLLPSIAGIGGASFCLWIVVSEIVYARSPRRKREAETEMAKLKAALKVAIKEHKGKATLKGERMMILWVSAFVLMFIVFGFWISVAAFIPTFLLLFGRENWKIAAIYTPALLIVIYLAFVMGMKMSLYSGILKLLHF